MYFVKGLVTVRQLIASEHGYAAQLLLHVTMSIILWGMCEIEQALTNTFVNTSHR